MRVIIRCVRMYCLQDVVLLANLNLLVCLLEVNLSCNFFHGSLTKRYVLNYTTTQSCLWVEHSHNLMRDIFILIIAPFFHLFLQQIYLDFIDEAFLGLQNLRLGADRQKKTFLMQG